MPSKLELQFEQLWEAYFSHIDLEAEVKLIPNRRFRFDFVHHPSKTIIEINGGNWKYGRHCRPQSLLSEYEKLNLAQLSGYKVFILTAEMLTNEWLQLIADFITHKSKVVL